MRILMINTMNFLPNRGGVATYSYEIAKCLAAMGDTVIMVTHPAKGDRDFDRRQPFRVIRSPLYRFRPPKDKVGYGAYYPTKITSLAAHLLYLVRRYDIDALHAVVWNPSAPAAMVLRRFAAIPYFVTAHAKEAFLPRSGSRLHWLWRIAFNSSSRVFAVSRFTRDYLVSEGVNPERVVVIPNGTDPDHFRSTGEPDRAKERYGLQGKKVLLTLSRLMERKGHDMVIRSLPAVLKEIPDAVYMIAGDGSGETRLREMAKKRGLEERIVFKGAVDRDEITDCYNACDVFVMPCRNLEIGGRLRDAEGFGISFLEANACGKPVIGGREGGAVDAIEHGVTGLLVDAHSTDEITEAMIRLLKNPGLASKMGRAGRERVVDQFSWPRLVERYREEMTKALSRHQGMHTAGPPA